MEAKLAMLRPLIDPAGFVWISWPKRASKVETDITEDRIRDAILPATDWVDVKVCAIDAHLVRPQAGDPQGGALNPCQGGDNDGIY